MKLDYCTYRHTRVRQDTFFLRLREQSNATVVCASFRKIGQHQYQDDIKADGGNTHYRMFDISLLSFTREKKKQKTKKNKE